MLGELKLIDDIAAIAGQRHAVKCLRVVRSRFSVLPCDASNPDDPFARRKDDDQTHLEKQFQLARNLFGLAFVECFRAIPALKQPRIATLCVGDAFPQMVDFPAGYQRRQTQKLSESLFQLDRVWVIGLLSRRKLLPRLWVPRWGHKWQR